MQKKEVVSVLGMNHLQIIGHGGFAKEVEAWARKDYQCSFYVEDKYANRGALPLSKIDPNTPAVIAIGDPSTRRRLADSLKGQKWAKLIHPTAQIIDPSTTLLMEGVIICAGVIITHDVIIQEHTHVNINTTIGHNSRIGRYNTISPAVNISGNVTTGSYVYIGTNAAIREKVTITGNTTIGMSAVVIGDIKQAGTHVGLVK